MIHTLTIYGAHRPIFIHVFNLTRTPSLYFIVETKS